MNILTEHFNLYSIHMKRILLHSINNTDMIKISRVMTIYTIEKSFVYVYITPLYTYTTLYEIMKYFIYVLQARYMYIHIELASNSLIFRKNKWIWCYVNKTEANLASTDALAARCVRVIHAQCVLQFALLSRTLLRSSSNNEPSDPPYRIIFFLFVSVLYIHSIHIQWQTTMICWMERFKTRSSQSK